MDLFYGTIFLSMFIIFDINRRYKLFDYNIRKQYFINRLNYYNVSFQYNLNPKNTILFLVCLYYTDLIYLVFIFKVLCLYYYIKKNIGNYIYDCNELLIYVVFCSFSSLTINKYLGIFGICFSDFRIQLIETY
jgi:hypothetical protein